MSIVAERKRGFSLVEMMAILVLLGILSATAVSRLNTNSLRAVSFQQELLSAIRFAQKFAIASGCEVQVSIDAATDSYALNIRNGVNTAVPASCLGAAGAFTLALPDPTGGNFSGNAPSGTDITAGLTFFYNRQGVPSASGTMTVGGQTITLEAGSGYVH